MDKISIIKSRINNSSRSRSLINIKDHVLDQIFFDLTIDNALSFSISKLIKLKDDYINSKSTKKMTCLSLDYYLIRGWDKNEARAKISAIQTANANKFAKKRKLNPSQYQHIKSPMTVEFWTDRGLTISEAIDKIKSQRPHNKKYWLNLGYSDSESKQLAADHQSNAGKVFSELLKKNPSDYAEKINTKLEYWMAKGFNKEDATEMLKNRQTTFSLDKCIEKYGKEKGQQVFYRRQKKWLASLHENFIREGDGRSPSSQFANSIIQAICSRLQIQVPTKEKYIRDKSTGMAYSYDFTLKQKRKIIEFNGDYWHCNPAIYEAEYFNKSKKKTAQEIWDHDQVKIELAERKGYQVLIIWESDWNDDPNRTVERCLDFLNN